MVSRKILSFGLLAIALRRKFERKYTQYLLAAIKARVITPPAAHQHALSLRSTVAASFYAQLHQSKIPV
jgi:hypothetical protein